MALAHSQEWRLWPRKLRKKALRKKAQPDSVTVDDLKSSIGKGPHLSPDDIAHTYNSNEEFLASFEEARDSSPPS